MTKPKLTYFDRKSFIWRIPGKEMNDKNIKYIKLLTSNQKIREDLKYLNLQKTEKYTRVAHYYQLPLEVYLARSLSIVWCIPVLFGSTPSV